MSAGHHDLELEQGSDFTTTLTYKDEDDAAIDLTSYTANLRVAVDHDTSPDFTLTESSGLTLGGTAGTIVVTITDTQVDALTWKQGWYDLVIISAAGLKTRIMQGQVFVKQQVETS